MPINEFPYQDNRNYRNGIRFRHDSKISRERNYECKKSCYDSHINDIRVISPNSIDIVNLLSGITAPRIEKQSK